MNDFRIKCVIHKDNSGYTVKNSLEGEVCTALNQSAG